MRSVNATICALAVHRRTLVRIGGQCIGRGMDGETLGALLGRLQDAVAGIEARWDARRHAETLALWAEVRARIEALGLFAPNEGPEDLQTSAMPCLLAYALGAQLLSFARTDRAQALAEAQSLQRLFAAHVARYRLLDEEAAALAAPLPKDAAAARASRIARLRYVSRETAAPAAHADEDALRQHWTARLRVAAVRAASACDSVRDELALLGLRATGAAPPREQPQPLRPFVLLPGADRLAAARAVFRPSHRLPTMTVDEYLAAERAAGRVLRGGPAQTRHSDSSSDDDDEATARARARDALRDEHAFGSGNMRNLS